MGSGIHGGFGNTLGAKRKSRFKLVQYEGTVKVGDETRDVSRRVYQRDDIDFNLTDRRGQSNIQRMLDGRPPIGNDGKPIQLHHVIQKENGPVVEVREMTHHEYYKPLHGLGGSGMSFRNDPVLKKQFNNFRAAYWKWRAQRYLEEGK